jgi:hypothetical protein
MNEYEAHLSSYDHTHKQRLKDMKAMVRDPNAGARARKAEARADGIVSIKIGSGESSNTPSGFKKGGFKKTGFKSAFPPAGGVTNDPRAKSVESATSREQVVTECGATDLVHARPNDEQPLGESEDDELDYQIYDPRFPTD